MSFSGDSEKRRHVFIVDDEATNLKVAENVLRNYFQLTLLTSGKELLQIIHRTKPDLLLLDIEMPSMSGFEVIEKMKQDQQLQDIPVIFLTAKNDVESELRGLTLGALDYINKPFSPPLLLKRIQHYLAMVEQKKELQSFNKNLNDMVREKTETILQLQYSILSTIANLVEFRDVNTGGHIERTQHYLSVLLKAMREQGTYAEEVSTWKIPLLIQSAQLHDVGKIAISDTILKKEGKLTPEETEIMMKHTSFGAEIIRKISISAYGTEFLNYAEVLAQHHHEKWDGTGYPNKLKGTDIPLAGRIMAIADVYDALVSARPYKKAFTHEEASRIIIEGSGTHFDPTLVEVFKSVADKFQEEKDTTLLDFV
ncbi:MAG: response regulator [Spirochaetaceae bacterium]|nr:response regulator [Spirochaetaceae bacterium]MBR3814488.1 response regulator [Spirochaetaceae bacterium]